MIWIRYILFVRICICVSLSLFKLFHSSVSLSLFDLYQSVYQSVSLSISVFEYLQCESPHFPLFINTRPFSKPHFSIINTFNPSLHTSHFTSSKLPFTSLLVFLLIMSQVQVWPFHCLSLSLQLYLYSYMSTVMFQEPYVYRYRHMSIVIVTFVCVDICRYVSCLMSFI